MAKKSTKKSSTVNWKVIGTISLLVNLILLVGVLVLINEGRRGTFDGYLVTRGVDKLCSKEFRSELGESYKGNGNENSRQLGFARIDFVCGSNDSKPYYDKAFKEYTDSLGIKTN